MKDPRWWKFQLQKKGRGLRYHERVASPRRAHAAGSFNFKKRAKGCDIMKELHRLRRLTLLEVSALVAGPRVVTAKAGLI